MSHTGIEDTAVWPTTQFGEPAPDPAQRPDATPWQDTIAAADHALEEATRIQRGVQHNLKLMQEVRSLREELRNAVAHGSGAQDRDLHASSTARATPLPPPRHRVATPRFSWRWRRA